MREAKSSSRSSGEKRMRCTWPVWRGGITQREGFVELERRCQELMQEVKMLSERQEVLAGLVEDKIRIQSEATEKYYETIFEELRELEVKKSKEVLVLVQKRHILIRCQSGREKSENVANVGRVESGKTWV